MGDYIFGYSVANDVSARDVQYRHKQNFLGKSLDTFFAMGPVIVTADEFPCPPRYPSEALSTESCGRTA
ncbi:MAG: fumarylacetoacetate hydrolase family protein [Dysosmobacter welbionis]